MRSAITRLAVAACLSVAATGLARAQPAPAGIGQIDTVVVIYAENRSFDNLYGSFPGANGLQNVTEANSVQRDRDGSVLKELPPIWAGLTAKGVTPAVTKAETEHLPNKPFAIDDPQGFNLALGVVTRDLWHLFYQNQMQIDGGKNDKFVAYANSGALVMGHYDGSKLPLWNVARKYVLADNFFQGAFGGSFLNHFELVCACVPVYPHADESPAKGLIAAVDPDGVSLKLADNSPPSAMDGIPKFVNNGQITPDFFAVNTMQPPYQPSHNKPAKDGDPRLADPGVPSTLPPQHDITIGDLLTLKGVSWAWYAGAWQDALDGHRGTPVPNFQFHHQPFNYLRPVRAGNGGARGASQGRRHERVGVHQGDRRGQAAAGRLLQAAGQPQPASRLHRRAVGRPAHRRRDRAPGEEPAMGAHAGRPHLRRERRLLGPRRAAPGGPLGPGLAHPGADRLALRQEGLRRPHALRHDLDPALHHQAFRPAGPARALSRATARCRRTASRRSAT